MAMFKDLPAPTNNPPQGWEKVWRWPVFEQLYWTRINWWQMLIVAAVFMIGLYFLGPITMIIITAVYIGVECWRGNLNWWRAGLTAGTFLFIMMLWFYGVEPYVAKPIVGGIQWVYRKATGTPEPVANQDSATPKTAPATTPASTATVANEEPKTVPATTPSTAVPPATLVTPPANVPPPPPDTKLDVKPGDSQEVIQLKAELLRARRLSWEQQRLNEDATEMARKQMLDRLALEKRLGGNQGAVVPAPPVSNGISGQPRDLSKWKQQAAKNQELIDQMKANDANIDAQLKKMGIEIK